MNSNPIDDQALAESAIETAMLIMDISKECPSLTFMDIIEVLKLAEMRKQTETLERIETSIRKSNN